MAISWMFRCWGQIPLVLINQNSRIRYNEYNEYSNYFIVILFDYPENIKTSWGCTGPSSDQTGIETGDRLKRYTNISCTIKHRRLLLLNLYFTLIFIKIIIMLFNQKMFEQASTGTIIGGCRD